MGKSQLAFAWQGQRPWYCWFASLIGVDSQSLYKTFFSVSSWFYKLVMKDLAPEGAMNSQFVHFAGRNIRRAHSLLPTAAAMGALPVKKRKTDVGTESMHLHFANLVDTRVIDVFLAKKELGLDNGEQWKPLCCFPGMEEDLLLYLAILGGTSYSGYYDLRVQKTHSTKIVFLGYMGGKVFPVDENSDTRSNSYKTFENMIAQALLRFNDGGDDPA
ncbi:hypothetical protein PI125_g25943 [Phytophthora idaei]|nr:hypothetical protein PI125_g25943 [Phytophthora idaei]